MKKVLSILALAIVFVACKKDHDPLQGKDITKAPKVSVDRFNSSSGTLFIRSAKSNLLPAANAPINFDVIPFITNGLTASGVHTTYYNLDVHPTQPDDIYVFFKTSSPNTEITEQRHVIPSLPGNPNYNDFWQVSKVMVPDYYVPNTLTSEAEILASGLKIVKTNMIVNCPVVPFGSNAAMKYGGGTNQLVVGWYNDSAVAYFNFAETSLIATSNGQVPIDDIYVQFNDNAAGPASGFKTEPGTSQTHNVIASSPGSTDYTPLWQVHVVDNAYFNQVSNLTTAMSANILNQNAALVNCPVVK